MARCSRGSSRLHALDRLDHVGAGLALDVDDHRRHALVPGADLGVLQAVDDLRDVAEQHRRAVAIGDDQRRGRPPRRRAGRWPRWCRTDARRRARPSGPRHWRRRSPGGRPRGRCRRRRAAPDRPGCAPPAGCRPAPRRGRRRPTSASRCAISVSARSLSSRSAMVSRGQRQRDDRRVRRVHLGVGRRIGKVARQRRARGVDRGLHVLRGAVDVAAEIELQRDLADAERARRGHHRQRRDLAELPLERRGHQRRRWCRGSRPAAAWSPGWSGSRPAAATTPAATSSRASRPAWSRSASSEVAIGRRMKGVETLIAAWLGAGLGAPLAPFRRVRRVAAVADPAGCVVGAGTVLGVGHRDLGAGGQARKARGHHALVRLQAACRSPPGSRPAATP